MTKHNIFTLKNKNGMTMSVSDIGGRVISLTAPDRTGKFEDVILSPEKPDENIKYFGDIIGRVGNRIAKGRFELDGRKYKTAINDPSIKPANTLHGGNDGFNKKRWTVREMKSPDGPALELTCLSPDGEENYPGNLSVRVVYTLTDANAWRIEYWAVTDAPTIINLTQHAYFNLTSCKRDVLKHKLQLFCDYYTPTDKQLIPTGAIAQVQGTPMDFTKPVEIGARINDKFCDLIIGLGYDHNFINRLSKPNQLVRCAKAVEPESGRVMECWTTEPCVQFYTGNYLNAGFTGKRGIKYTKHFGFCLETQHAPDAPHHKEFPTIRLDPGEVYYHKTEYRFSAK